MKRTIAVIAGGDSSEHDISLKSASNIAASLDKERYDVYIVEIKGMLWEAHLKNGDRATVDRNDFSFMEAGQRIRPDFAYITIHGTPGENGILQGYFDLMHLPYSTSDVLTEAMTFNKFTLNQYLKGFGVSVSESLIIRNSVSTYLYNAVKNHCLSLMNRGIIKEKVMNSIQKAMRDNYDDTDSCTAEELYRKYEEAIRSLPESMRDAFEKSRFGNMKFKEIANEAGVSVKTVEYRIYGAVKILRAKLKDYLPFFVHILWL